MAGPFGGSATVIAVAPSRPQTVLVGARNGLLFRSDEGGANWRILALPRFSQSSVQSLWIDPQDSERFVAGLQATGAAGAGLWETTDGGRSWRAAAGLEGAGIHSIAAFPGDPRRLAAATRRGLYLSLDAGHGWRRITPPDDPELAAITAVAFDPRDAQTIYAGTTHLPWKTTDGGQTWRIIHTGMLDDSDVFSIFVDPERPMRVLASACSGIYRSLDGGARWQKFAGIPDTLRRTHVIRQDPRRPNVVYAGTTVGLLRSLDSGVTWRKLNSLHVYSLEIDPLAPDTIYLATDITGVWKSNNRGETLVSLNDGFVSRKVNRIAPVDGRLLIHSVQEGAAGGLFASENGDGEWRLVANGETFGGLAIQAVAGAGAVLFAASEEQLLRSPDGGKTWRALALPAPAGRWARAGRIQALQVVQNPKPVVFVGTDRGLLRSLDLGASFHPLKFDKFSYGVQAIYPAPMDGPRVMLRTTQGLYLSEDAGEHWRPYFIPLISNVLYDIAFPERGGPFLVATPEGLLASAGPGSPWNPVAGGLPGATVSAVRFHPGRGAEVYAVVFGKVYRSVDGGANWAGLASGPLDNAAIRGLWIWPKRPDRLFAATQDLGVLFFPLEDGI